MRSTVTSMREWMPRVSAVPLPAMSSSSCVELVRSPAHNMQHRAEHFFFQFAARSSSMIAGATYVPRAGTAAVPAEPQRAACMPAIQRSSLAFASASITGPTWVASSRGSPSVKFARGAHHHLEHALGHVVLHAQQAQRRAALAGGAEGGGDDVVGHLLGQRGGVDDHGVDAAGLGDQRRDRPVLGGERAVDDAGDLGRAGEDNAGDAGCAVSSAPTLPSPGTRCSALAGTPAACRSFTASEAISGVCSAGLATTALPAASAAATWPVKIASGKFHGLMQTKTPRPR